MKVVWFTTNYYESLGDIYAKYSFLNLKNNEAIDMIDNECINFLSTKLMNKRDLNYFSYDLRYDKRGEKITILADNIICALWFIGEFPMNPQRVLQENRFENTNFIYTFNEKSYKLNKKKRKNI